MKKLLFAVMIFAGSIARLEGTVTKESLAELAKQLSPNQIEQLNDLINLRNQINARGDELRNDPSYRFVSLDVAKQVDPAYNGYSNKLIKQTNEAEENVRNVFKAVERDSMSRSTRTIEFFAIPQTQPTEYTSQSEIPVQQQNNFINTILTYKKTSAGVLLTLCAAQWIILYKLYKAEETDTSFPHWLSDNIWTAKVLTVTGLTLAEVGGLVYLSTHQAQA